MDKPNIVLNIIEKNENNDKIEDNNNQKHNSNKEKSSNTDNSTNIDKNYNDTDNLSIKQKKNYRVGLIVKKNQRLNLKNLKFSMNYYLKI